MDLFVYFDWFFSHNGVPIAPFKTIQTILKKSLIKFANKKNLNSFLEDIKTIRNEELD